MEESPTLPSSLGMSPLISTASAKTLKQQRTGETPLGTGPKDTPDAGPTLKEFTTALELSKQPEDRVVNLPGGGGGRAEAGRRRGDTLHSELAGTSLLALILLHWYPPPEPQPLARAISARSAYHLYYSFLTVFL